MLEVKACGVRLSHTLQSFLRGYRRYGVPTYTAEEPREIRFEELELGLPEESNTIFPEVLELNFGLSL